jgi:hypothetical protein
LLYEKDNFPGLEISNYTLRDPTSDFVGYEISFNNATVFFYEIFDARADHFVSTLLEKHSTAIHQAFLNFSVKKSSKF